MKCGAVYYEVSYSRQVDERLLLIRDSFIPAFDVLEKTLQDKLAEVEEDSEFTKS